MSAQMSLLEAPSAEEIERANLLALSREDRRETLRATFAELGDGDEHVVAGVRIRRTGTRLETLNNDGTTNAYARQNADAALQLDAWLRTAPEVRVQRAEEWRHDRERWTPGYSKRHVASSDKTFTSRAIHEPGGSGT